MKNILIAIRPKTLIASISPICIGTSLAFANGSFYFGVFLFTCLTGLGIQISTNFANDLFDFIKGADTSSRKGPIRVTASGLLSISQMKLATFIVMALTALCGSVLVIRGGLFIACLVALALIFAIAYTAGPYPLAYLGLAELFILIFFGPVASGCTYYLQTLNFKLEAFLVGFSPGLISCALLIINNLRDREEDKCANKNTLIVRFGPVFGKWEYAIALFTACLIPLFFYEKHVLTLLCLTCAAPAFLLVRAVFKNPHSYRPIFEGTGKLLFLYTVIFSVGCLL